MRIFEFRDVLFQLPNLLFRRRLKFNFELLPFEARELSLKKIRNFFMAGLNQFFLPEKPFGYPVIAQVEPTNFCNLTCPLCLTTSQTNSRPKSTLSFDTFKAFIDELGDYLLLIILWNWGEPFLNPDIIKMIKYAKSKNILIHSSTNGNVKFDNEKADELVKSGLDSLVFAVDGATQETYSKYRKGGDLNIVLENIRSVVRAKKRLSSKTPQLNVRFVVMQHNEKELPMVQKLADELEVDFFTIKTVDLPPAHGDNLDNNYAPEDTRYRRYEYKPETYTRKEKLFECMRPWKRITLDVSGEVVSCEYDYNNSLSFGNINKEKSALTVWKGTKARELRKKFNRGNNSFYHCKDCSYKNNVFNDCIIEKNSLKSSE
jgi:radical SAM protein with 4Fe4S-binding SPASM domain